MSNTHETAQFLAVLTAEETALLSGNYAILEQLTAEKQRLGARLPEHALNTAQMKRISRHIVRNAALLEAAKNGFEDARKTIKALQTHNKSNVYDQTGARQSMRATATHLERKA